VNEWLNKLFLPILQIQQNLATTRTIVCGTTGTNMEGRVKLSQQNNTKATVVQYNKWMNK